MKQTIKEYENGLMGDWMFVRTIMDKLDGYGLSLGERFMDAYERVNKASDILRSAYGPGTQDAINAIDGAFMPLASEIECVITRLLGEE